MSQFINDEQRRMVPRWRNSRAATKLKETQPLQAKQPPGNRHVEKVDESFEKLKQAWEEHRGMAYANDLVAAAIIHRKTDGVQDAAEYVLANERRTTRHAVRLAQRLLGGRSDEAQPTIFPLHNQAALHINQLRRNLRHHPDNPIGWTDLARQYIILGEHKKAERAMQVAIGLAPNHRFILRAASRLFHVLGDLDHALQLLRKSEVSQIDPWLIAAEIAISRVAGRTPRFTRRGKILLDSERYSPFHTSELAASLASLDFEHGSDRQARKKFQLALREPTENTIAQATWAHRHHLAINVAFEHLHKPSVNEARAWSHYEAQEWEPAIKSARDWLEDEPFSSRSAIFGGHVASVALEDNTTAIEFLETGLVSNPFEFSLLNNLAFCLATANRVDEAITRFKQIQHEKLNFENLITYTATSGLIEYRLGRSDIGRKLYSAALAKARTLDDKQLLFNALCFFAREERRVHGSLLSSLLKEIEELYPVNREPSLIPLIKRLKHPLISDSWTPKQ
jgi:tetratricopeptide (TPR) repeat protein